MRDMWFDIVVFNKHCNGDVVVGKVGVFDLLGLVGTLHKAAETDRAAFEVEVAHLDRIDLSRLSRRSDNLALDI